MRWVWQEVCKIEEVSESCIVLIKAWCVAGKQVFHILNRTLNTVRKEPTQIVTALRIVEREERADQFALQVLHCI